MPGYGGEYRILISRAETMDDLCVQVEYDRATELRAASDQGVLEALRRDLAARLRSTLGVRAFVRLEPPGTLARTEFKARRVIDDRDLYRGVLLPDSDTVSANP